MGGTGGDGSGTDGFDWDRYRRIAIPTVFVVGIVSILLLGLAILFYPGGSQQDRDHESFSFYQNYLCDLGRTVDFRGGSNAVSSALLRISLSIIGIGSAFFMAGLPTMVPKGRSRVLVTIGAVMGTIAGLAYVAMGNTPWNVHQTAHTGSIHTALVSNAFMCFFLFLGMKRSLLPRISRFLFLVPLVFSVEYILHIYFEWPAPNAVQKFVVFTLIGVFLVEAVWIMRYQRQLSLNISTPTVSTPEVSTAAVGTEK